MDTAFLAAERRLAELRAQTAGPGTRRSGTMRRLHEVGFVKSAPQKIIADRTNWRFFNEFKRELKI